MQKNLKLKKSSGYGKIIDSTARLLHHKRPFTREGNYLVVSLLYTITQKLTPVLEDIMMVVTGGKIDVAIISTYPISKTV